MSADFSQYIDLTIYDKEPGDLYLEAIEMARLTLPEFNLRPGTVEDAIFQAMAWIGWVNATSINRIPDRLMAGILSMMGVTIQLSLPAQMGVVVAADSYQGATIPVGTLFGYSSQFEDEVIEFVFITTEPLVIPAELEPDPGEPFPSGIVNTECLTPGIIPNISAGTELTILSPSTSIISAEAHTNFQNGVNEETSSSFLSRAVSYLNSLSSTVVKASQVDALVANTYSGLIDRVRTYDLTDGDNTSGDIATSRSSAVSAASRSSGGFATLTVSLNHQFSIGDKVTVSGVDTAGFNGIHTLTGRTATTITYANSGIEISTTPTPTHALVEKGIEKTGHITVFAYGKGNFLTQLQLDDVKTVVSEKTLPGLFVDVKNMQILNLSIEATISLDPGYDQSPLIQTIENSIIEYLSPSSYPASEDSVIANKVIAFISSIPGVLYVVSLSLGTSTGNWLPKIGENLEPARKGWAPRLIPDNLDITYLVD
jgi:hypothetical protein